MSHMASHDGLTGLYNRMALINRLQQALDDAQRGHDGLALLFCDLDGFKPVNDTHGHDVGDRLLCAIAQRLQNGRRKTDTIARLGGDEFVIVLTHLQDPRAEGTAIAQDYIDALGEPYGINGIDLSVSVSIGVSVYEGQATTVSKLISQADTAMYEAKRLGKNKYCLYD
jgi:diguanylate cyclase (GGDEF)-like protein